MKIYNYILSVLIICLTAGFNVSAVQAVYAEPDINKFSKPVEQTDIQLRKPDSSMIESFKSDNDFNYSSEIESALSLWDRFVQWLRELFIKLFFTDEYGVLNDVIIYSLTALALLIIIIGIFKTEIRNIFQKNVVRKDPQFSEFEENIHELDFDELISRSIHLKNYRFALRLTFLKLLKELDSKGKIKWRIDRTNHELLNQINDMNIYKPVNELTYEYENVWYGGFDIDENIFNYYREKYNQLLAKLQGVDE